MESRNFIALIASAVIALAIISSISWVELSKHKIAIKSLRDTITQTENLQVEIRSLKRRNAKFEKQIEFLLEEVRLQRQVIFKKNKGEYR